MIDPMVNKRSSASNYSVEKLIEGNRKYVLSWTVKTKRAKEEEEEAFDQSCRNK